ncbi:MAG: FGGY-family carbohydrate kinase [Anaerolineales bacterium]
MRDITTQMQCAGAELREWRAVGGGAKSRLWNQIKADVTGLQVNAPEITETTALCAAFLALAGIGDYATLSEASEHIIKIRERIDPDPQTQPIYTESYDRYRHTYFAPLPLFEDAAKRAA